MDDIDRLPPNDILELFQLIKLNANFSNVIFLISFDKSVVTKSIKSIYKFNGERYLEKIVQVDYNLPSILPEEIESLFYQRLHDFLEKNRIDFEVSDINSAWLIDGLKFYFRNIRDINRYFNGLLFRMPAFHKNINVHDFLLIEAIRVFDFSSYELIRDNFKEYKQFGDHTSFSERISKVEKGKSKGLYKTLFNTGYRKFKNTNYRINELEFFDRYFSLTVSKKDMREEELVTFLNLPSGRVRLLENIISSNQIEFLLRRLSIQSTLPKGIDIGKLIDPIISIWNSFPEEFTKHYRLVWKVIKTIVSLETDPNKGYRILFGKLLVSSSDFSPARFVFTWLLLQYIESKDPKNNDPDLLAIKELLASVKEKLKQQMTYYIKNYQGMLYANSQYNILYRRIYMLSFAAYEMESYIERIKGTINDDDTIFLILNMIVLRDSKTSIPFAIDDSYIEWLLPKGLRSIFEEHIRSVNLKALPSTDATTVRKYLEYLDEPKAKL